MYNAIISWCMQPDVRNFLKRIHSLTISRENLSGWPLNMHPLNVWRGKGAASKNRNEIVEETKYLWLVRVKQLIPRGSLVRERTLERKKKRNNIILWRADVLHYIQFNIFLDYTRSTRTATQVYFPPNNTTWQTRQSNNLQKLWYERKKKVVESCARRYPRSCFFTDHCAQNGTFGTCRFVK